MDQHETVVITGIGVVSPLGNDLEESWTNLIQGKSGTDLIEFSGPELTDPKIAAQVNSFDTSAYLHKTESRRMPLFVQYAVVATEQALQMANLNLQEHEVAAGVEIGSALGGASLIEDQRMILEQKGERFINPTLIPNLIINSAACSVAIRYGIKGPVSAPVAACATGSVAIGEAYRKLLLGDSQVMIAGGSDSLKTRLALTAFERLTASSKRFDDPQKACRPFDLQRDGTVVGEGAAVLVLETLTHARERGARILGVIRGYGLTCDAYHLIAPDPQGLGAAKAMQLALDRAQVSADSVDWICAHGTGTPRNDSAETAAILNTFGQGTGKTIPVSSIKGSFGHTLGAAGAISTAMVIKSMMENLVPPTINYEQADPECDLNIIAKTATEKEVNRVLVNAFGFGGQNACLVVETWQ